MMVMVVIHTCRGAGRGMLIIIIIIMIIIIVMIIIILMIIIIIIHFWLSKVTGCPTRAKLIVC